MVKKKKNVSAILFYFYFLFIFPHIEILNNWPNPETRGSFLLFAQAGGRGPGKYAPFPPPLCLQ